MSVGDSVPHARVGWAWLLGACGRSRSVRMASGAPSERPSYIIIITVYHYRCRKHASFSSIPNNTKFLTPEFLFGPLHQTLRDSKRRAGVGCLL